MKKIKVIRNTLSASGLIMAINIADSLEPTRKEILIAVILILLSTALLLLPIIEKELSHK